MPEILLIATFELIIYCPIVIHVPNEYDQLSRVVTCVVLFCQIHWTQRRGQRSAQWSCQRGDGETRVQWHLNTALFLGCLLCLWRFMAEAAGQFLYLKNSLVIAWPVFGFVSPLPISTVTRDIIFSRQ